MIRRLLVILALVLALQLTAFARGGGFGGGRGGGFGGGVRGGGGISYGGSRSRSYGGGGYRYPSAPIRIAPRFYGGPRFYRPISLRVFAWLAALALLFIGSIAASQWYGSRFTVVNVGIVLSRGDRYARKLDQILAESDFTTPGGRAKTLHRIAKMVDDGDVIDGFTRMPGGLLSVDGAAQQAESVARTQMQQLDITPNAVNVASEGNAVSIEAPSVNQPVSARSEACILGIAVSVRGGHRIGIRAGDMAASMTAIQKLYEVPGKSLDALYLYYAPNAGEPLSLEDAKRAFSSMRRSGVLA